MTFPPAPPAVVGIQRAVCERYGLSREHLLGPRRGPAVTGPRQQAIALAAEHRNFSLTMLGRYFGRHHTTVMHAIQTVARRADADPRLQATLAELRERAALLALDADPEERARRLVLLDRVQGFCAARHPGRRP